MTSGMCKHGFERFDSFRNRRRGATAHIALSLLAMPLEIREVIIKARIETITHEAASLSAEAIRELKEQVVQEAMERLHQLLAEKSER